MIYKLLALDIDGTILRSNYRIAKGVREAIAYVQKKGVYVTLATRRHFSSAKKIAKALKLDTVLITHNGAFIADEIDNPLFEKRIIPIEVDQISTFLERHNCHVRLKHERYLIANRVKQNQELIARMTIGDPLFYPVNFTDDLSTHLEKSPVSPPQIEAFFNDESEGKQIKSELKKHFPSINVYIYPENRMEIVSNGVSKGSALLTLGKHLGIASEEMVAVGDSVADLSMMRQVGLGVAMGNAVKEVKNQADWITRSNNQSGVHYMAKEVFRKQLRTQIYKI